MTEKSSFQQLDQTAQRLATERGLAQEYPVTSDFLCRSGVSCAAEVIACALEVEANEYDKQYGPLNLPAGILAHAAQIVRGLDGGDFAYLMPEAISRAVRRSANAE